MAETREVVVRIVNSTDSGTSSKVQKPKSEHKKETSLLGKFVLAERGLYKVGVYAMQTSNFYISRNNTLTEDYIGQTIQKNITSTVQDMLGVVYTITSATTIGSAFGPVGSAVGAGVGAVMASAGLAVTYANKYSEFYQTLNANNYNTSYSQVRAGLTDSNRGTEN